LGPGDLRAGVHRLTLCGVELRRQTDVSVLAEAFGAELAVPLPLLLVGGGRIHHLRALPIPFGMPVAREDVIGHVPWPDNGARHDAADLLTGTSEAEDRAGQDAFAGRALRQRPRALIRLRVIDHDQRWPHRVAIG